ncbi:MAG: RNA-binding cell elongation regulator Jag/EloR [Sediminispirochaetaceae bacterium]
MIREFEGKTEKEAIDNAVTELNLDREHFDVEIMETTRGSIFRKGNVKIRVYIEEDDEFDQEPAQEDEHRREPEGSKPVRSSTDPEPQDEFEEKIIEYIETLTRKMGFPGRANVAYREPQKVGFNIDSEHSGILIGKKGKNLDSLQLLTNIYAGRLDEGRRVVIDAENYRSRHEDSIIRNAHRTAAQVRRSKRSRLLEPMNPFERRLVHTALNDMKDIETKSEGEGLYKQVRIIFRGGRQRHY